MKKRILPFLFMLPLRLFCQQGIDTLFQNAKITGVQMVITNKNITQTHYYGKPNTDETNSITGATVFQAASLSKVVMAFITLWLVERNLIALDTPLYRYYRYERIKNDEAAKKITARMVLQHTTGFPNWATNPISKQWAGTALSTGFIPGSAWSYSGEGFMFLQFAVEKILNQSLEKIATEEVFSPLQMGSSSFLWRPSFTADGAYGHNKNGELTGRPEAFLPGAAYSMLTTAADYNRFLQAVIIGQGLSKPTHQLMLNDMVSVKKKDSSLSEAGSHISWALGLGILRNEAGTAIWHWGDNGDFKCFFMAYPATHKSLVYFTNSENGLTVMPQLLNYYFGKHTWWALQWLDRDF
jgi:CubicO group peptidase (beta-lactamase class C family)